MRAKIIEWISCLGPRERPRTERSTNRTSVLNPGLNYRALNSIRDTGSRVVIHINKVYAISSSVVRYVDNVGMKNVWTLPVQRWFSFHSDGWETRTALTDSATAAQWRRWYGGRGGGSRRRWWSSRRRKKRQSNLTREECMPRELTTNRLCSHHNGAPKPLWSRNWTLT